jgi:hypothetical protein
MAGNRVVTSAFMWWVGGAVAALVVALIYFGDSQWTWIGVCALVLGSVFWLGEMMSRRRPASGELELAQRLLSALRPPYGMHELRGATIGFAAICTSVARALENDRFFPPELRPEDLGDGALIERLWPQRYRVHERYEVGQLRFSELSSRSYFFLRSAVGRYLRHYRAVLRVHQVKIRRWS